MAGLATLRQELRAILGDSGGEMWSNADLDRHLARAVVEYGRVCPRRANLLDEMGAELTFDFQTQNDWLYCLEVESPPFASPRRLLRFREPDRGLVELIEVAVPAEHEPLLFWYARLHEVRETDSTVPAQHEGIVLEGAAGRALLEAAAMLLGRYTAPGQSAAEYSKLGEARLARFALLLDQASRAGAGALTAVLAWAGTV